jgi:hypothetical protein
MRKIDKSIILSTAYKKWEEEIVGKHPAYNSSNFKFYVDIVMNLYHCQHGLCAYTEKAITLTGFEQDKWTEGGRYMGEMPAHYGELEHFDESLKTEKAWLWDNFFMVEGKINRQKHTESVDNILKPDSPHYDPFELLAYNQEEHIFYPNTENPVLDEDTLKRIETMIHTLRLNYVKDWRRKYLLKRIKAIEFGLEPEPVDEYVTAFEMIRRSFAL